jgi:hypothetical protein
MVLDGNGANNEGPNPDRVRDHNSPTLPAMRQHSHTRNLRQFGLFRQRASYSAAGSKSRSSLFPLERDHLWDEQ